jgi:Enoyl-CoA hydratase/carnithine racemase
VVARIAGHCVAGGIGLAAACDLSIADGAARFGFTEVRIGVAPAIISVVCLPKLRRADALELFLSGERITAARAAEVGLITRAVPAADLDAEVAAVVARLLAGGPSALAAAKRLVYTIPGDGPGGGVHPDHRGLPGAVRLGRGRRGDGRVPGEAAPVLGPAARRILTGPFAAV